MKANSDKYLNFGITSAKAYDNLLRIEDLDDKYKVLESSVINNNGIELFK